MPVLMRFPIILKGTKSPRNDMWLLIDLTSCLLDILTSAHSAFYFIGAIVYTLHVIPSDPLVAWESSLLCQNAWEKTTLWLFLFPNEIATGFSTPRNDMWLLIDLTSCLLDILPSWHRAPGALAFMPSNGYESFPVRFAQGLHDGKIKTMFS